MASRLLVAPAQSRSHSPFELPPSTIRKRLCALVFSILAEATLGLNEILPGPYSTSQQKPWSNESDLVPVASHGRERLCHTWARFGHN